MHSWEKWRTRGNWNILGVFENEKRMEIIKILLKADALCLSDIAKELEKNGYQMNLPGVVKHVQKLQQAKILRSESGSLADEPDARKTIYTLHGKKRVEKIMNQLTNVRNLLESARIFNEAAEVALRIQTKRGRATEEEIRKLESSLTICESPKVTKNLTEDEKRNVELWKKILT